MDAERNALIYVVLEPPNHMDPREGERLRQEAEQYGYNVVEVITDQYSKGVTWDGRKGFREVLDYLSTHDDVSCLIISDWGSVALGDNRVAMREQLEAVDTHVLELNRPSPWRGAGENATSN
jgi:hypothetical protein